MQKHKPKLRLKTVKTLIFFSGLLVTFCFSAHAATYYVDYENGSDSNNGLSTGAPWKHSPGDSNGAGVPASQILAGGDRVLFKGGVIYRGSILLDRLNNGANQPIIFKGNGWGNEKAIIDGSQVISNFTQCRSASDCGGNSNWNKISYADLGGNYKFDAGFFEDNDFLWYSQEPNPVDPFYYDRTEYLRVIPMNDTSVRQTRTSITDPRYLTQSNPAYWNGAYVIAWRVPNGMSTVKVTRYDPDTHTLYHEDLGGDPYSDRDSYYSILDHISMIDREGEYCLDESRGRLYVWPKGNDITRHVYSVLKYETGFFANSSSNLVIEGFIIQKFTMGIRLVNWSDIVPENVVIRDNEVRKLKSKDWYAIQVGGNSMTIENNSVTDAQRGVGILAGGSGIIVRSNFVQRTSRQGIWFMGASNSQITGNTVVDCKGTHANGISVYQNSQNITVNGNRVSDSNIAFTFETSSNLNITNNIFLGDGKVSYVVAGWGGMTGTVNFFNNVVLGSENHFSTYLGPADQAAVFSFKNNIVDGGGSDQNRSNNIYVGLSWGQDLRYGWQLGAGEIFEPNLLNIFLNPFQNDYHLKAGSPAIDAGTAVNVVTDISGVSRPRGSAWDIGAYEYVVATDPDPPRPPTNVRMR